MITRRAFSGLLAAGALRAQSARPNIVLIVADDLGYGDLSSYGAKDINTPAIDSIGKAGARLTQFYDNAPECTPTRCALLTGRYQHRVGGLECAIGAGNVGRYDEAEWLQKRGELGLPASEITVARMLKDAGYKTACFGKWHLGYEKKFNPVHHGFGEYFGILGGLADYFTHKEDDGTLVMYHNEEPAKREGYTTDLIADAAIDWLKGTNTQPYFLYVPFTAPHIPIQDPDKFDPATGTAPTLKQDRPTYCKMVERMDKRIADILAVVKATGREDNTIVVFISDNGAEANGNNGMYRGHKTLLWEGGIRVPCLIRWPGKIPAGSTVTQPSITMDLAPTLLAAAGIKAARSLDGMDLLPMLKGQARDVERTLFWRYKRMNNVRKAVLHGQRKMVIDNGKLELHDLSRDPKEQNDLAPSSTKEVQQLMARIEAWENQVAAPRLESFRKPR